MPRIWNVAWAILASFALFALTSINVLYAAPPLRDCAGAAVWISSPAPGSTINGATPIVGAASLPGDQFRYYKVEYSTVNLNAWVVVVDGVRNPVNNGPLASFDASLLPEGDYTIRVLAVDPTGNYCEGFSSPIHVTHDPNAANATASPAASPTPAAGPAASPTPAANPTLVSSGTSTPSAQGTSSATRTPLPVQTPAPGTPTLVVELPSNVPGQGPDLTKTLGTTNLPQLTDQLSSVGTAVSSGVGQLGQSFVFGIQMTAGLFILLGIIVFLRHNL